MLQFRLQMASFLVSIYDELNDPKNVPINIAEGKRLDIHISSTVCTGNRWLSNLEALPHPPPPPPPPPQTMWIIHWVCEEEQGPFHKFRVSLRCNQPPHVWFRGRSIFHPTPPTGKCFQCRMVLEGFSWLLRSFKSRTYWLQRRPFAVSLRTTIFFFSRLLFPSPNDNVIHGCSFRD